MYMYKAVITLQKAIISTYRLIINVQNHDANGSTYDASYELDHSYHCAAERETCKRLRTVIVLSIVGIGSLYGISNKITVVLHSCQLSRYWRDSHDICISVPCPAISNGCPDFSK